MTIFSDWNNGEIETRFAGFITDPKEAGAIFTLDADQSYSVIVEGVDGGTGWPESNSTNCFRGSKPHRPPAFARAVSVLDHDYDHDQDQDLPLSAA